jgi:hypothetical protein
LTSAESRLDELARARMKRTGEGYAKSCGAVLMENPQFYADYEKGLSAGRVFDVPAPVEYFEPPINYAKRGKQASHGSSCPECDAGTDEDDLYCAHCGAKPTAAKRKRRSGSTAGASASFPLATPRGKPPATRPLHVHH